MLTEHIDGLDRRALDRARLSRDPRFDGRFFIGVRSTGIYCRPICPSPTSKRINVRYYASAAAAEAAGFRPCLRCRPEAAPGTPGWRGTSAVVQRALRLIEEGALNDASVDVLATRVGLGARHLDRLFLQHVGASPLAIAQSHRLTFARELLEHTDLSMTEIALTAGFGSLRRFNHAFRTSHGCTPSELRTRGHAAGLGEADVVLKLAFRPPYDWSGVCDELAAHAVPGVERVDASRYARVVATDDDRHALVCVRPLASEDALELRVSGARPTQLLQLSTTARRVFDLAADPASIATAFACDPLLASLAGGRPGFRVAGAWSPFECAVCMLLAHPDIRSRQHVTPTSAIARLVEGAGRAIEGGVSGPTHVFPSPAELARARLDGLGLGSGCAAAVRALAKAVSDGTLDFDAPVEDVASMLSGVAGFDARAVQLFAMRALGDPDAFPAAELVHSATVPADALSATLALAARAEAWRPWRSYAAVLLSGLNDAARFEPRIRSVPGAITRSAGSARSAR
jgi:AraC family transcriptional regulator of adaptative response / DNA-3-methyladenine glycosylase II